MTTLVIGVAVPATANAEAGMRQTAENLTLEGLLNYGRDGRPVPFLAHRWSRGDDGLTLRLQLQPSAIFHDGSPVMCTSEPNRAGTLTSSRAAAMASLSVVKSSPACGLRADTVQTLTAELQ